MARLALPYGLLGLLTACGGASPEAAEVTALDGVEVSGKETRAEHCDGEDNDGDGRTDEDCGRCDYMVTRGSAFYTEHTCVLSGGGTGIGLLPVSLVGTRSTTTLGTAAEVVAYLGAPASANASVRLGQQIVLARFNRALFSLGDTPYHDWNRDGVDETVDALLGLADGIYAGGSTAAKDRMTALLLTLNADGTRFPLWFDAECLAAPEVCNGLDDDDDGVVDETCRCVEVCDGVDNDDDGLVDPDCAAGLTLTSVAVTPQPLYTDTDAAAVSLGADSGGAALIWRFQWYTDGVALTGQTGPTLSATAYAKGDTVRVDAWVDDGTTEVGPVSTSTVVEDAPPPAPEVHLETPVESSGLSGLLCRWTTAVDPDGDTVEYVATWTVDGAAYLDATATYATGDSIPNRELARGGEWTCTVTASDGTSARAASVSTTYNGPAEMGYAFETVGYVAYPTDLAVLASGRLLVSDLLGGMHLVDPVSGAELASAAPLDMDQELIAFALHPDFGDGAHDWIYLYSSKRGDLYRFDFDETTFSFTNEALVLNLPADEGDGHCGGGLQFWSGEGSEPLLYLGTGPMHDADSQVGDNPGQKILALRVDPATGDVSGAGLDPAASDTTVTAYGTRNPWRITDCGASLCFADPGNTTYEEIDLYSAAGQNFGYPNQEGPEAAPYEAAAAYWDDDGEAETTTDLDGSTRETFTNVPFVSHRLGGGAYGGRLEGYIFYGDFYDGWVRALRIDDAGGVDGDPVPVAHQNYVTKFAEAADGTVYIVELGGSIRRLVLRADRATVGPVGEALSTTEYSSATAVTYSPAYALWSNGADKVRTIYLPLGTLIDNTDEDRWVWPDGTRIYKEFSLGGQKLETRVLAREGGRWIPGVYRWDAAGTDAYLSEGYTESLSATTASGYAYVVPSTELCNECHASERGAEWPLSTQPVRLGDTGLATLAPLLRYAPSPAPVIAGSANTRRVRGYLDTNCAFCHNPAGVVAHMSVVSFDLSYDATMDTSIVAQYYHANPNRNDGDPVFDAASPRDAVLYRVIRNTEMPLLSVVEADRSILNPLATWLSEGSP